MARNTKITLLGVSILAYFGTAHCVASTQLFNATLSTSTKNFTTFTLPKIRAHSFDNINRSYVNTIFSAFKQRPFLGGIGIVGTVALAGYLTYKACQGVDLDSMLWGTRRFWLNTKYKFFGRPALKEKQTLPNWKRMNKKRRIQWHNVIKKAIFLLPALNQVTKTDNFNDLAIILDKIEATTERSLQTPSTHPKFTQSAWEKALEKYDRDYSSYWIRGTNKKQGAEYFETKYSANSSKHLLEFKERSILLSPEEDIEKFFEFSRCTVKVHIMPQLDYLLEIIRIIDELLNANKDFRFYIDGFKVRRFPESFNRNTDAASPLIVLYINSSKSIENKEESSENAQENMKRACTLLQEKLEGIPWNGVLARFNTTAPVAGNKGLIQYAEGNGDLKMDPVIRLGLFDNKKNYTTFLPYEKCKANNLLFRGLFKVNDDNNFSALIQYLKEKKAPFEIDNQDDSISIVSTKNIENFKEKLTESTLFQTKYLDLTEKTIIQSDLINSLDQIYTFYLTSNVKKGKTQIDIDINLRNDLFVLTLLLVQNEEFANSIAHITIAKNLTLKEDVSVTTQDPLRKFYTPIITIHPMPNKKAAQFVANTLCKSLNLERMDTFFIPQIQFSTLIDKAKPRLSYTQGDTTMKRHPHAAWLYDKATDLVFLNKPSTDIDYLLHPPV